MSIAPFSFSPTGALPSTQQRDGPFRHAAAQAFGEASALSFHSPARQGIGVLLQRHLNGSSNGRGEGRERESGSKQRYHGTNMISRRMGLLLSFLVFSFRSACTSM